MSVSAEQTPSHARHRRGSMRRRRLVVLIVVLAMVAVLSGYEYLVHGVGGPGTSVTIEVTSGESFSSVATDLANHGVISSTVALRLFDLFHGTPSVQPGYYALTKNSTFQAVHDVLGGGPNVTALTVPPGFTIKEVEQRLATETSATFTAGFKSIISEGAVHSPFQPPGSTNLEGLIGSGTYLLQPGTEPLSLVKNLVARFNAQAASVGLTPSTVLNGHDAYALATIASVVEKEGYQVRNMARVSRVVENRLARSMPLQMDSTVLYAIGQDGGPVTSSTEQIRSPYNSYLNSGLPPTPICTSSVAALGATMHPAVGAWLYFTLIDKTGTMGFSTTFAGQLANEKLAASNGV